MSDRVHALSIEGLRCIDKLSLPLQGLTVLIGDNGSGKSTILEAAEILRRASTPSFYEQLHDIHGGLYDLLRKRASALRLGVRVAGAEKGGLSYSFALAPIGNGGATISEERLEVDYGKPEPLLLIVRSRARTQVYDPASKKLIEIQQAPDRLVLPDVAGHLSPHAGVTRMRDALANIEVHVPFDVMSNWIARGRGRMTEARGPTVLRPASQLDPLGGNLANVYYSLRNLGNEDWQETMRWVRMGLGDHVKEVITEPAAGGGTHAIAVQLHGLDAPLPARSLSDGQLAFLTFVALARLKSDKRSLLAFDEPETYLHPALVVRVADLLANVARRGPVLVATHSDALLNGLVAPQDVVRICELEPTSLQMRLRTLDADALQDWLRDYRGVGDVRSAGFLREVVAEG